MEIGLFLFQNLLKIMGTKFGDDVKLILMIGNPIKGNHIGVV